MPRSANDPQTDKQNLIKKARDAAAKTAGKKKKDARLIATLTQQLYDRVAAEDILDMDVKTMSSIASSLWEFAQKRPLGQHKLRIYNPTEKSHGWHAPRSVIEVVNDDMPFLIDSISQEVARRELGIHIIIHPVLTLKHDKDGNITDIFDGNDAPEDYHRVSFIHLQVNQLLTQEIREELEHSLSRILDDVRAATTDWQNMLGKLRHAIGEIDTTPAPISPDDLDEAKAFLRYLHDDNFTLLGYREYDFAMKNGKLQSIVVPDTGMGILRDDKRSVFKHPLGPDGLSMQIEALEMQSGIIVVNKLNSLSTVHRRVPLDAVSVKQFDADGKLRGEKLFVGLFTSVTYSRSVTNVPYLRQKVAKIHELAGFRKGTHDDKALNHILEKYPRDELFQITIPKLLEISLGILRLQERPRLALFMRRDHFERFVSCLIYVPREQFKTELRRQMQEIMEDELKGQCSNFYTTLDDSPLARVLFFISTRPGHIPDYDQEEIEAKLSALATAWPERLRATMIKAHGDDRGVKLAHKYARAFSTEYTEKNGTKGALYDISEIEKLDPENIDNQIGLDLYKTGDGETGKLNLKVYHAGAPVPLSDILPMLENMGLRVVSEQPFSVHPAGTDTTYWIHDFGMTTANGTDIRVQDIKQNFEDALKQIWAGRVENDGFNHLALTAGLNWREIVILRAYARFLRQAAYLFGQRYIEHTLAEWSGITRKIVALFLIRHDPTKQGKNGQKADTTALEKSIEDDLEQVSQLDHDRILRSFLSLVKATLRTNFFQNDHNGVPKRELTFKFDSRAIEDLPHPRPFREIFVYSPRFEGVHLRGGLIARGGLRWSDRREDFRTEILGLMKAQMVKNSVIVPVGAKGGFVLKQPPKTDDRDAFMAEGVTCYKLFIKSLLDLTDNNVGKKVVPPVDVVRYDDDDPYLVVAADKGTATFSDIANEIAAEYNFWLGDAFASGGCAGYDHKKMGITARGAWESVKRHFREMGVDIQNEDFTCVGVGDMGGDVFGNGMLLSKHTRLVGAFNHLHIFCDPNPDAAESFKERQRLFKAVKGWGEYDTKKLSAGGRIYERSAKSLDLTPQIKDCFGIKKDKVTPAELIRAMLQTDVDLLWFGGIGTYIKASHEPQSAAGDKTNDALRINANQVRAKVIGEGANLGVTQAARVEYALHGGRLNTDFIDNSGGVDASDHEVNIKILLSDVMSSSKTLSRDARDKLLADMTDEVANLVLANNYRQGQCITLAQHESVQLSSLHMDFIRDMERNGIIDRNLEGLPDDETVEQRLRKGIGLTRPELAVLVSYAKILLFNDLLESSLTDEDSVADMLTGYFPHPLQKKYSTYIHRHKLRREIIATELANSVVNRLGPVFVKSRMESTGASPCDIVRAYVITRDVLGLTPLWKEIEALDNKVQSDIQIAVLLEIMHLTERAITWLLVNGRSKPLDVAGKSKLYGPGIGVLQKNAAAVIGEDFRRHIDERKVFLEESGLPANLAKRISTFPVLETAFDVIRVADDCKGEIVDTARIYFGLGEYLSIGWLRQKAEHMPADDHWQGQVLSGLVDEFFNCQTKLTKTVIVESTSTEKAGAKILDAWIENNHRTLDQFRNFTTELRNMPHLDITHLTLAAQRLRRIANRSNDGTPTTT